MKTLSKSNAGHRDWLKDSRTVHGNSTSTSMHKERSTDDTPKAKVKAMGDKTTDMAKTSTKGNSSGGGKSSQRTTSMGNGGNTKWTSGIVGSRKQ